MYFKVIKWIEPFMEIKHFSKGWCLNFLGRYLKSFGSSLLFGCFRLCLCCFVIVWNSPKRNHFSSYYQVSKNIQFFDNFLGLEILKFSIFSYFCFACCGIFSLSSWGSWPFSAQPIIFQSHTPWEGLLTI